MYQNFELDNLHSILEDLSILLLTKQYSREEYEEEVKTDFKKYTFTHYKGLAHQAYSILINYCSTKEEALNALHEMKNCIIPGSTLATA